MNELKEKHGVRISIPLRSSHCDDIVVEGKKLDVQAAIDEMNEIIEANV